MSLLLIITVISDALAMLWLGGLFTSGMATLDRPATIPLSRTSIGISFLAICKIADLGRIPDGFTDQMTAIWLIIGIMFLVMTAVFVPRAFYEEPDENSIILTHMPKALAVISVLSPFLFSWIRDY